MADPRITMIHQVGKKQGELPCLPGRIRDLHLDEKEVDLSDFNRGTIMVPFQEGCLQGKHPGLESKSWLKYQKK